MNHPKFLLTMNHLKSLLPARTLHRHFLSSSPPPIIVPIPKPNSPHFSHSPPPPNPHTHPPPIPTTEVVTPANLSLPNLPNSPTSHKTELIAISASVSLVIFILLSVFAFFLYRRWKKHASLPGNLFDGDSQQEHATDISSSVAHLGIEQPRRRETSDTVPVPVHKQNSIQMPGSHQPSPELSPMPPLIVHAQRSAPDSSSDEETEASFFSRPAEAMNENCTYQDSTAPDEDFSSATQLQGVSIKTQFSDSSASDQQAITQPLGIEQYELRSCVETPSSPNWQEKDHILYSLPSDSVPAPPATMAESSGPLLERPQTLDGESGDSEPEETRVSGAQIRFSRPPSLTAWIETTALVEEDGLDEISAKPLDLVDDKEDKMV